MITGTSEAIPGFHVAYSRTNPSIRTAFIVLVTRIIEASRYVACVPLIGPFPLRWIYSRLLTLVPRFRETFQRSYLVLAFALIEMLSVRRQ